MRVLCVVLEARRLIIAGDFLILLIAHKHTNAHRWERLLPTLGATMTKASWRVRIREGALSLLGLSALLSILYVADFRVRESTTHIVSITSNTGVARYGNQLAADTSKVVRNVRDGGMQHAALTGLVGSAAVLLLCMLKS